MSCPALGAVTCPKTTRKAHFFQGWSSESSGGPFQCVVRLVCMLASQRNVFCVSCISVIAGSCIEVGSLIEPERMITHPRTIDLWQRSKKICMFSLCLIPSTYQGIIVRMSSAHCAGTFCCILTVSERKDLKVCRRKKKWRKWEGTSWVQESCLVF